MLSLSSLTGALSGAIEHHAAAWWVPLVVLALAALDGLLPPLPAESVVIALAAYAASGAGPNPFLLALVAFVGAVAGDNLCYTLGRHLGLARLKDRGDGRLARALRWADRELRRRGGMLIFVARYIPIGRLAVNLTAGAARFPRSRFLAYDVPACATWAAYSVAIGYFFGNLFHRQPLLGSAIGIACAVLLGWSVDNVVQRRLGGGETGTERTSRQAGDGR